MKADHELRHKLFGQQGSIWERQLDDETRARVRTIVAEAGHAPLLAGLDRVAASAASQDKVLMEDVFFSFADGNFAVIGQLQRSYSHRGLTLEDGTTLHVGYLDNSSPASYQLLPLPTTIARIADDFLALVQGDPYQFVADLTREWYLVPIPAGVVPLVIQSRNAGEYLVQGVDFLAYEGFIALTDTPASVLPLGLVKINSAYVSVTSPHNFVLSAPSQCKRNKWIAEYTHKNQSLTACRRAAAEYAGLYVFHNADIVLAAQMLTNDTWVYSMAVAGVVAIDYPHAPLIASQAVEPGYIICSRFDLVNLRYRSTDDTNKNTFADWPHPLVLDGILPVKGLTWNGRDDVEMTDGGVEPITGNTHLRVMFDGATPAREQFWTFSAAHEKATGNFLHMQWGEPPLPVRVNFWEFLRAFYGSQLALAIADDHGPVINSRLWKFLFEHHPQSCNILLSMDINAGFSVARGSGGEPMVDEDGNYVPA